MERSESTEDSSQLDQELESMCLAVESHSKGVEHIEHTIFI